MIFSRSGRAGRHARDDRRARRPAPETSDEVAADAGPAPEPPAPGAGRGATGPYDLTEAPAGVRRLDLGSLHVPSVPGVELRVQANPDGLVQRVALVHGESALQVAAFAAPRSEGIWDEVREEIRASLFSEGVAVEEVDGDFGRELRARVRTQEGLRDLRVVGVDGPRWMVRADFHGPAARDPASAPPLVECLRGLVVDRGGQARPVREPLPLRLSSELAAQLQRQRPAPDGAPAPAGDARSPAGDARSPAAAPTGERGAGGAGAARRKPSPGPRRRS